MPIVKKTRPVRESDIEKKVCDRAKSLGWITPKFKSPMNRGVPDRIFMRGKKVGFSCPVCDGSGKTLEEQDCLCDIMEHTIPQLVYVEFKAPGKEPTEQQALVHKQYREMGFPVWVIDNVDEGYLLLALHSD